MQGPSPPLGIPVGFAFPLRELIAVSYEDGRTNAVAGEVADRQALRPCFSLWIALRGFAGPTGADQPRDQLLAWTSLFGDAARTALKAETRPSILSSRLASFGAKLFSVVAKQSHIVT